MVTLSLTSTHAHDENSEIGDWVKGLSYSRRIVTMGTVDVKYYRADKTVSCLCQTLLYNTNLTENITIFTLN